MKTTEEDMGQNKGRKRHDNWRVLKASVDRRFKHIDLAFKQIDERWIIIESHLDKIDADTRGNGKEGRRIMLGWPF